MPTIPTHTASVLWTPHSESERFLPEGPRMVHAMGWDWLMWVNIQTGPDAGSGSIHLLDRKTGEHRELPQPARPGFVMPTTQPNQVLVGLEKEIVVLDLTTNSRTPLARIPDESPRTIINDGEILPGGESILFGTKDIRFADPLAAVYRFHIASRRIEPILPGQTCSNGKVFRHTPNGLEWLDIDTPTRVVRRFRFEPGSEMVLDDGIALDLRKTDGFPDGMVAADDHSVIIAFYNPSPIPAGCAIRFDLRTGQAIERYATPGSPRVTCPLLIPHANGGSELILTTADEGMPAEQQASAPNRGCLFALHLPQLTAPASETVQLA
ncbi:SMP-30/gluconolactonase/LRE family protein [Tuwongella immobilis]|uniref:SMP-30/Gluconolactonase/LRE-like region domain-containing protein n=1 Tax=Tuwongella immobilis TaxID=692036 RepID=A0A6C2YTR3_9BACT|nr:SMP-30/gluconolactonase/LRE family protein [Tuwongella immobilis]VIP04513.1 Gluconolactonase OS=Rhodopirellula baltica WH47 GN=RBWH47_02136 PE=4 SV=1: SGL [Tuwongella immobilis]VTS06388.1 Gluconolactonase OS=Rhodopirellula baltica WH47 GN=RBWH47_02136 PE=4 SV=1: SGL [Tuwongella immobilis]